MLLFPLSLVFNKNLHLVLEVIAVSFTTSTCVLLRTILVRSRREYASFVLSILFVLLASFVLVLLTCCACLTFFLPFTRALRSCIEKIKVAIIRHIFSKNSFALIVLLLLILFEDLSRGCSCHIESFQGSHDKTVSWDRSHYHEGDKV